MQMTDFKKTFRDTMYKITNNIEFINAEYLFARRDEVRQEIIDGINNGTFTTTDDIAIFTAKMSPCYHLLQRDKNSYIHG